MSMEKRMMSLSLSDQEMEVLEKLAEQKGLTKTALLKQCLRLYQAVDVRLERGEKVYFEDEKKQKSELLLL